MFLQYNKHVRQPNGSEHDNNSTTSLSDNYHLPRTGSPRNVGRIFVDASVLQNTQHYPSSIIRSPPTSVKIMLTHIVVVNFCPQRLNKICVNKSPSFVLGISQDCYTATVLLSVQNIYAHKLMNNNLQRRHLGLNFFDVP